MPKGNDLLLTAPSRWESGGLLLNPRMDPGQRRRVLETDFPDQPGHIWTATSGSGGMLKIVALSQGALAASAAAVNKHLAATPDDVWLNPLPLFHVGGLGIVVRAALSGASWVSCPPWDPAGFAQLAADSRATLCSLVPTQVFDLVARSVHPPPFLRAAVVGGSALAHDLFLRATALGWPLLPSYGLTEAASQVATAAGHEADSTTLPLLPHVEARITDSGALALRGSSLLTGWMVFPESEPAYWEDPKQEGWLTTGDRAELTARRLRVLGRLDDLVKIRGELVDLAALERALQTRIGHDRAVLRATPDGRNGQTLKIVALDAAAAEAARAALDIFPPYARPGSIEIGPIPKTALGKIIRHPRTQPPPEGACGPP